MENGTPCKLCGTSILSEQHAFIEFPGCKHRFHLSCEMQRNAALYHSIAAKLKDPSSEKSGLEECTVRMQKSCSLCNPRAATPAAAPDSFMEKARKEALNTIKIHFVESLDERRIQMVEYAAGVNKASLRKKPRPEHLAALLDIETGRAQAMCATMDDDSLLDMLKVKKVTIDQMRTAGVPLEELYSAFKVRQLEDLCELGFDCDRHLDGDGDYLYSHVVALYGVTWRELKQEANLKASTLATLPIDVLDMAMSEITTQVLFEEFACTASLFHRIVRNASETSGTHLEVDAFCALGLTRQQLSKITLGGNLKICLEDLGWLPAKVRLLYGKDAILDHTDPDGKRIVHDVLGIEPEEPTLCAQTRPAQTRPSMLRTDPKYQRVAKAISETPDVFGSSARFSAY